MTDEETEKKQEEKKICSCGYEDNTFACRIRHQTVAVGHLKRERESNTPNFGFKTEQ